MTTPKVLVVYQYLPHYRYGVFTALQSDQRVQVHFASGHSSPDGSIPALDDTHLSNLTWLKDHWKHGALWQSGLLSLVLRGEWDAVIFLGDAHYVSTWAAAVAARLRRTKVYFWTIGWHRRETGIKRTARMLFYRLADGLLLYGDSPKQFGREMGFPDAKMKVIYNSSASPNEISAIYTPPDPQTNPYVIGAAIRLNPGKLLHLTVEAAGLLRNRGWDVEVEILGEGPERARIEQVASQLNVPLHLPGAVYDPEKIRAFYDRLAVVVLPSQAGLSTTQGMRHGRPVITHDDLEKQMPECEAVRPGVTGSFYPEGSVPKLSAEIESWLIIQTRHAARTAKACHAEVAARWSPEAHANSIIEAILDDIPNGNVVTVNARTLKV